MRFRLKAALALAMLLFVVYFAFIYEVKYLAPTGDRVPILLELRSNVRGNKKPDVVLGYIERDEKVPVIYSYYSKDYHIYRVLFRGKLAYVRDGPDVDEVHN